MGWLGSFNRLIVSPREINDLLPLMAEVLIECINQEENLRTLANNQKLDDQQKYEQQLQYYISLINPQLFESGVSNKAEETALDVLSEAANNSSQAQSAAPRFLSVEARFSNQLNMKIAERSLKLGSLIEDLSPRERLQFFHDWLENCKVNGFPNTPMQIWSLRALALGAGIGTFAAAIGATSAVVTILGLAFPPALAVGGALGLIAAGLVFWGVLVKRSASRSNKEILQYQLTATNIKQLLEKIPVSSPERAAQAKLQPGLVRPDGAQNFTLLAELRRVHGQLKDELSKLQPDQLAEIADEVRHEQEDIMGELVRRASSQPK